MHCDLADTMAPTALTTPDILALSKPISLPFLCENVLAFELLVERKLSGNAFGLNIDCTNVTKIHSNEPHIYMHGLYSLALHFDHRLHNKCNQTKDKISLLLY